MFEEGLPPKKGKKINETQWKISTKQKLESWPESFRLRNKQVDICAYDTTPTPNSQLEVTTGTELYWKFLENL